jgi:uncharacterized protein
MDFSFATIAMICAALLLAGFVKGVIGLGLPTISIGLLSLIMAPAQAAALLMVPSTIANIQQMRPWTSLRVLVMRLWPMMAGIVAGTLAAGGIIAGPNAKLAAAGLGLALVSYAIIGLLQVRFSVHRKHEAWLAPVIGAITGTITAATGVFVIPAVPYLQAIGFEKDDLVQALGLSFFVSTLALAVTLTSAGLMAELALLSLAALAPALAGQFIGQYVRSRLDPVAFRRWFFIGLLVLGGYLVLRWVLR